MKQALFILAGSFISTLSFAQLNLGVTNSTHAAVQKSINVGSTTSAAANAAKLTTGKVAKSTDVNAGTRVKAQAETHASEQAKAHANENSAVFGAKVDNNAKAGADADVQLNGSQALDATQNKAEKTKVKMETTADGSAAKTKQKSADVKSKVKTVSGNAKEKVESTSVESNVDVKSETTVKAQKQ